MNREEQEQIYLEQLPLFVSIPRSGCNWFQAVMEIYFNRHRGMKHPESPSWMTGPIVDPMWAHTHDNFNLMDITVEEDRKVIFLHRNPTDTIYSLMRLQNVAPSSGTIGIFIDRWNRCYRKWTTPQGLSSRGCNNPLVISYEEAMVDNLGTMKKVSEHFGKEFDEVRAKYAFETVGDIKKTNEKNGDRPAFKNKSSGTPAYIAQRKNFQDDWSAFISERT